MPHITLNGETRELPAALNVEQALQHLQIDSRRVAVELNRHIVPRREWTQHVVQDGDVLEVVQFVGGG